MVEKTTKIDTILKSENVEDHEKDHRESDTLFESKLSSACDINLDAKDNMRKKRVHKLNGKVLEKMSTSSRIQV